MDMVLLYVTFPNMKEAQTISNKLLEDKKIVCSNIIDAMTSIYMWEGSSEQSKEVVSILKTTPSHIEAAVQTIEELHSYEAPAILEISAKSHNKNYSKWITENS
jgi:periplasmic divalent cation tolerance protein